MVSVSPNPAPGFYFFYPMNMGLPGLSSLPPANAVAPPPPPTAGSPYLEDLSKKIRKPYTITKSRESWTDQERDKFLEALQLICISLQDSNSVVYALDAHFLAHGADVVPSSIYHCRFDRDWKKIEAFVGSKTVIQIRSHAQKYFLKAQKNGATEHVPPPRPKRKAAHPYPQKAPKNAAVVPQVVGPFQSSSALLESGYTYRPDSSSVLENPIAKGAWSSRSYDSVPPVTVSQRTKDDATFAGPNIAPNCCYSSSKESTPRIWSFGETIAQGDHRKQSRVVPDFSQVYTFLGSVFDPGAIGVEVEISLYLRILWLAEGVLFCPLQVVLLMRNLATNLKSPEFEDQTINFSMDGVGEFEAMKHATLDLKFLISATAANECSRGTQLTGQIAGQLSSQNPSVISPAVDVNARRPPQKPSVGHKKPLEPLASSQILRMIRTSAVRAAVEGDDISKRQLTAEQAWQRCASGEMGKDEKASSEAGKDLNHKSSSTYEIKHKGQSRA
ncbi:hypothetical protein Godav_026830 [Gossypium davidsonii]|uniref:Myb-like domain-containing protein n=1 Tax=Gossypium davidsonii TaxID=34287 RepID=A0A7J8RU48_GOSDV|nr:hypothetical protein [Gossypium davidsonii]